MSENFTCPCDGPTPVPPLNAPGLATIAYRDATFGELRRALLTPQPGETQLSAWRPGAPGDLATMMVEWWAYLGDILTFYNERIANEDYLRTAVQPASVRGLIRLLGYRPQPGIGATVTLGALAQPGPNFGVTPVLPAGLQVQSKPAPGQSPQIFELAVPTPLSRPDAVVATARLSLLAPNTNQLLLAGAVSGVTGGDYLVLRPRDGDSPSLTEVDSVGITTPPGGSKQTTLMVSFPGASPAGPAAAFRLEKPSQTAGLWSLPGTPIAAVGTQIHLNGLVRTLKLGDAVLFTDPADAPGSPALLTTIKGIQDVVWDNTGAVPTKTSTTIVLHTMLTLAPGLPSAFKPANVTLYHGWVEVAQLLDQPVPIWPPAGAASPIPLVAAAAVPTDRSHDVLIADATGAGVAATARSYDGVNLGVSDLGDTLPTLQAPLSVMFNLLAMTRGKTIPSETLGSGNPALANQSFQLAKSPLTYLRPANALVSTLQIRVSGQLWTEVDAFFGQAPDAQVFVVTLDDAGVATVEFGDGVNGARLPSGSGNIIATYRFGSGAHAPAAGSLTSVATPVPGLRAVRNPVAAGAGADPDPPDQIRVYAPRSVLTFGRAVSAPDFVAIAASISSNARVSATWAWDGPSQRTAVTIHVAGDVPTITSVRAALLAAGDPNRPVQVVAATPLLIAIGAQVVATGAADPDLVKAGIVSALTDPATGLFGAARLSIGQAVFNSQISEACQSVPGCLAVELLVFLRADIGFDAATLHTLPEGSYFSLDASLVFVEVQQGAVNGG